jgi:transposase
MRYQIVDNYSWTRGAHSAKFGVDFQTTKDWTNQLYNGLGNYTYSTLSAFAADFSGNATAKNYSSMSQAFGNPIFTLRTTDINFYGQDTWKLSRRVTLNYGLRYEKTFIPQPTVVNPDYPQTGRIPSFNKNFAPRASMSFSLSDRTVLRAGYGIFWARYNGNALTTLFLGNGKYQTTISVNPTTAGAPVFPRVFASAAGLPAGSVNLAFADPQFHNPYSQQGTLALEHQLTRSMAVTFSYIWSRGVALWTKRDLNLAAPTATRTYTILDSKGATVGTFPMAIYSAKVDSRYARIYQTENGGQSWYNGLAIQFRKRMSYGLSLSGSYTWSHAIDDAAQNGGSSVVSIGNLSTFNGDYPADKGSSGMDQRHRAVITFVWQPKFTKSTSGAAKFLANGWELSTITTMASAQPAWASVNVSGQQFTGISMPYTTTMNGSGGWTRVPFWPVNNLDVDRVYRVDARLTRNLPFSERVKGYLLFEAFNAFNTQYNTGVQGTAFTASGGILRPQVGLGMGNQAQGFPDGSNARRCQVALRITF